MESAIKKSLFLGVLLGLIFWYAANLEKNTGMLLSIIACVVFGPVTVWLVKIKPSLFALLVCLASGVFLLILYGLVDGSIYLLGVAFVYGIFSVQLSIALVNSYENISFIASKFKNRK